MIKYQTPLKNVEKQLCKLNCSYGKVVYPLKGRYQTQIPTLPTFFSNLAGFAKNEILS